jgi:uncharacterized protein YndB with AHSA1/START domain
MRIATMRVTVPHRAGRRRPSFATCRERRRKVQPVSDDDCPPIEVSRRIEAPAHDIFQVLADPSRHLDLDGSGMLRGVVTKDPVTKVGDVFTIEMRSSRVAEYEINNHVVEFEPDRRIGWEPEAGHGHPDLGKPRLGHRWTYQLTPDGDDATVVTEIYDCSLAPEDRRRQMNNGQMWAEAMAATLERLAQLVTGRRTGPAGSSP